MLEPRQHLGPIDPSTVPEQNDEPTEEELKMKEARKEMPGVDSMLLLDDFEEWAEKVLSGTAWNYYKSAGEPWTQYRSLGRADRSQRIGRLQQRRTRMRSGITISAQGC
jgi:hypothetical protein